MNSRAQSIQIKNEDGRRKHQIKGIQIPEYACSDS